MLSIPTFGLTGTGGGRAASGLDVPLPVKVVRVAIPEGAEVSLETIRADRTVLKGLRPGPAGASNRGRFEDEVGPTAAPETGQTAFASPTGYGPGPVRLGQIGYFRFQRFVEVIYTPVVAGPAARRALASGTAADLDFYPEVEADIVVTGARLAPAGPPPADPHFEDSYRRGLLNYDEGRSFRVGPRGTAASPAALSFSPSGPTLSPFANAITPVYRLFAKTRGIYRLTWSYLLDPATGVAPGLSGAAPSTFKLMNKGVEVPIRVVDGGDGTFGPGDFIEFYGEGILDEPELVVNVDFDPNFSPGLFDILQANDVTDENVYFLFGETGARSRIPNLTGTLGGGAIEGGFVDTVRREFDTVFVPDGVHGPFFQTPVLSSNGNLHSPDPNAANCGYANANGVDNLANFLGPGSDPGSTSCAACTLSLPPADPNATSFTASVRARVRGASRENANPDHMAVLQVGDAPPRPFSALCWDDEAVPTLSVNVSQSALVAANGIYLGQPGLTTTAGAESLFLDWIEADYRRALKLSGGALLAHFPNAARNYEMSGFPTTTAADTIIYDISRTVAGSTVPSPRLVTGGTPGTIAAGNHYVRFTLPQDAGIGPGAEQRFAAAGFGGFLTPLRASEVGGDDLTAATNAADMIVITTPVVVGAPPVPEFTDYLAHREADSGITTRVVMMRHIYDQFSDGIETPEALRSFLAYAVDNWRGPLGVSPAPSYVMLVGDISADYKNNLNLPLWVNQVPTFIMYQPNPFLDFYASDTYIAAFRGSDQLPDIHLGRISVRTPAEAAVVFGKLLDYDTNAPSGPWRSKGLFLADRSKPSSPGESTIFEGILNGVADSLFVPPFSNQKLYYAQPPYNGADPNSWRDDYVAAADDGAAVTTYVGHGAFDDWGGVHTLFNSSFLPLFAATGKPTFLINENCLVAGFHNLGVDALGENFLKADGKGAAAVFGPTGLSFSNVDQNITDIVFGDLFGVTKERRFGNLMTDVRVGLSFSITDMQAYTLLGDPAQRLILPGPRPPTDFHATGGLDAHVDLGWSPSPDAGALTRIYRRETFTGYTLVTPAGGVAGTAFVDATAINGKTYFYRAASVDPNGPFEGGVSNLNDDCNFSDPNASGPGCVWAVPINPNAPSTPASFKVFSTGLGDRLDLSWAPAGEPDLLKYTVLYGTTPNGPYNNMIEVPASATGVALLGLTAGVHYYMIATVTNTSGKTSPPTDEADGIPWAFDGVAPPDIIGDLDVLRSAGAPDSIELRWTGPLTDIYGGPADLSSFAIYRGTFPAFVAGNATRIASVANPSAGSYTDPGAFVAPPNYFYLVTATDARGFASGAGSQLPNGITDLTLATGGGNLILSWTPVTTDVDGNPAMINNYVVYADSQPVGRAWVDQLTPLAPFVTQPGFSTPVPGGLVYYSVIAVDVKGNRSPF